MVRARQTFEECLVTIRHREGKTAVVYARDPTLLDVLLRRYTSTRHTENTPWRRGGSISTYREERPEC
jgi:hypothetical protein